MRDRIVEDFSRAMAMLAPQSELPIDAPSDYYDPDVLTAEERQEQRETDGDAEYHRYREWMEDK
jgi:hypothetical protein